MKPLEAIALRGWEAALPHPQAAQRGEALVLAGCARRSEA